MKVVLNAMVPPAQGGIMVVSDAAPLSACVAEVRRFVLGARSYIGHPATAAILEVATSRDTYVPQVGDIALVVSLTKRASQPGDVSVTADDLTVRVCLYASQACLCGDAGCFGDVVVGNGGWHRVLRGKPQELLGLFQGTVTIGCLYVPFSPAGR
jgi:hypothetical protein